MRIGIPLNEHIVHIAVPELSREGRLMMEMNPG